MNKLVLYLLAISVIIATLSACDSSGISSREKNIFKQDFQTKLIKADSFELVGDFIDHLNDAYCVNLDQEWPYILYDYKAKEMVSQVNRNTIMLGVEPPPCVKGRYNDKMILEIIKDGYNTEVENFITEIDSIPSYVIKQMLSFGQNPNYAVGALNNGIWLSSKRDDKLANLNPYINKIIEGYLLSINKYSKMAYLKDLKDLSEEEYLEIASEFNFRLSFKYTDKPMEFNVRGEEVL